MRLHVTSVVNTDFLFQLVLNSKAGCVKNHMANWKLDAIDPVMMDVIKHYHIEFGGIVDQCRLPNPNK